MSFMRFDLHEYIAAACWCNREGRFGTEEPR
jgi:hypothetical protein